MKSCFTRFWFVSQLPLLLMQGTSVWQTFCPFMQCSLKPTAIHTADASWKVFQLWRCSVGATGNYVEEAVMSVCTPVGITHSSLLVVLLEYPLQHVFPSQMRKYWFKVHCVEPWSYLPPETKLRVITSEKLNISGSQMFSPGSNLDILSQWLLLPIRATILYIVHRAASFSQGCHSLGTTGLT